MPEVCRGCRQPIRWAITEKNGKPIPLDPDPVPNGRVRLIDTPEGERAVVLGANVKPSLFDDAGEKLYMPHHATCPNAEEFRGGIR